MRTRRPLRATRSPVEAEWQDAELVERIELLEAKVAVLEHERARLETELVVARSWVKELALWFDEAQARSGTNPAAAPDETPLEGFLAPETVRRLREAERPPVDWRRSLVVAALVLVPWLVLGLAAYFAWILVR